jgi:radical SAM protein with 4Fe4S-binding SPASM domain
MLKKNKLSKITNLAQLFISFWLSRLVGRPIHWGLPFSLSVEPVNYCNLRCPQCPTGLHQITRAKGYMSVELFKALIGHQHKTLSYLILYLQGEPFLHPRFTDFARIANEKGIFSAVSTNGHFLNVEVARKTVLSGLDRLIVSVDGASQAVYQQYRVGGKLETVLDGMRNIISWKKKLGLKHPLLEMQFIVFGTNESEIDAMKKLKHEIKADVLTMKTAQIYDYENGSPLFTSIEKLSRYKKNDDGTFSIKNKLANHCWRMWSGAVVTEDGNVLPCCFDKDAKHVMGNIKEQTLTEIWNGEKYKTFRTKISESRSKIEMCKNCTEGTRAKDQKY